MFLILQLFILHIKIMRTIRLHYILQQDPTTHLLLLEKFSLLQSPLKYF